LMGIGATLGFTQTIACDSVGPRLVREACLEATNY